MPKQSTTDTVTLPALPEGRVYVSLREMFFWNDSDLGKLEFKPGEAGDYMNDGLYEYGCRQTTGDGGSSLQEGESRAGGRKRRYDSVKDGSYRFGIGGGPRLTTLDIVLREQVKIRLLAAFPTMKGVDADKKARNPETAFRSITDAEAAADPNKELNADSLFGMRWNPFLAWALDEAARRDTPQEAIVSTLSVSEQLAAYEAERAEQAKADKTEAA